MEFAVKEDAHKIIELYKDVIDAVNKTNIKLGWNIEVYPNDQFVYSSIENGQMCILREGDEIIAAAVVNHTVNAEYDDIDWKIKAPKDKISTIHALATSPSRRGKETSDRFLKEIEEYSVAQGDIAIHLDVIDTNIPAYKLYTRNGFEEMEFIEMYYEVVGTRHFWMLEKVLQINCT